MDKAVEQEKPMDRTKDVPEVTRTEQSIAFYLDNKLEQFSNGRTYGSDPSNKTNGYHAAKVPDWQLRRWADETNALTAEIADLRAQLDEAMEALEDMRFSKPDDDYQLGWTEAIDAILAILAKRKQP